MKKNLSVPVEGSVEYKVEIGLLAVNRKTKAEASLIVDPGSETSFSFPDKIGTGKIKWDPGYSVNRSDDYLQVRSEMAEGWVLAEVETRYIFSDKFERVLIPSGWGRDMASLPDDFKYRGNYPGWSACVQWMAIQLEKGGVGLCCLKNPSEMKFLEMKKEAGDEGGFQTVMSFCHVPELKDDIWQVANAQTTLYSWAGGWENGAKQYREMVEKVRPEIAERKRNPIFDTDPIWLTYNCFAYDSHTYQQALDAVNLLNGPVMFHLYNWTPYPFDTHYPELFDARQIIVEEAKDFKKMGVEMVPYLNARIWDTTLPSYKEKGKAWTVEDIYGELMTEIYEYSSNYPLAVTCQVSEAWQDTIADSSAFAMKTLNTKGIYLDQIGAAFGRCCYSGDHGHTPGGAAAWFKGQRDLLKKVREKLISNDDTEPFVTIENTSEQLVDLVDGFLYYCGRPHEKWGDYAPIWQAIYGDITHNFADNFEKVWLDKKGDPLDSMMIKIARQGIFGNALGWVSPHMVQAEYSTVGDFLNRLHATRLPILKTIHSGVPVSEFFDATSEKCGVMLGVWKADDSTVALAVNPFKAVRKFTWPDGTEDTLPPLDAKAKTL